MSQTPTFLECIHTIESVFSYLVVSKGTGVSFSFAEVPSNLALEACKKLVQ